MFGVLGNCIWVTRTRLLGRQEKGAKGAERVREKPPSKKEGWAPEEGEGTGGAVEGLWRQECNAWGVTAGTSTVNTKRNVCSIRVHTCKAELGLGLGQGQG